MIINVYLTIKDLYIYITIVVIDPPRSNSLVSPYFT